MEKETVKMASMMELREQAKAAGIKVPFGCKKADLVKLLGDYDAGNKKAAEIEAPKLEPVPVARPKANWGANEANNLGGRCCVHCKGNDTRIVGVRHVGKLTMRHRKCNECHKHFPTREIAEDQESPKPSMT